MTLLKSTSVLGLWIAGVTSSVIKKTRFDDDSGCVRSSPMKSPSFSLIPDVIALIISFCSPEQWNDLFTVSQVFHESKPNVTHHFHFQFNHYRFDNTLSMEEQIRKTMNKPGWKGVISDNNGDFLIINHWNKDNEDKSTFPFSGRILCKKHWTAKASEDPIGESLCDGRFCYYGRVSMESVALWVRDIRSGQAINFAKVDHGSVVRSLCEVRIIHENLVVCMQKEQVSLYTLDWEHNKVAKYVTLQKVTPFQDYSIAPWSVCVDPQNREATAIFYIDDSRSKAWKIDVATQKRTVMKHFDKLDDLTGDFTPDGHLMMVNSPQCDEEEECSDQLIIQPIKESSLLNMRIQCQINSDPKLSHNSRYVLTRLLCKPVLIDLHNGVINVIPEISEGNGSEDRWLSDEIFLVDGCLRCTQNPTTHLSQILFHYQQTPCDAADFFKDVKMVGPNLFYFRFRKRVVQFEWLPSDQSTNDATSH